MILSALQPGMVTLQPQETEMQAFREHLQYRAVDLRYALSAAYAHEWERISSLPARRINPVRIVGSFTPQMAAPDGPTDLCVIGRRERRKGPDLAVDIAWAAKAGSYRKLQFIGDDSISETGVGSNAIMKNMARLRGVTVEMTSKMSRPDLDRLFLDRNAVILPSRYDQFNLVALKALRLGCPVSVSRAAGAGAWIQEHYPSLADLVINIDCSRVGAAAVRTALDDYDALRQRIVDAIDANPPKIEEDDLGEMFEPFSKVDFTSRTMVSDIQVRFDNFNRPRHLHDQETRSRIKQNVTRLVPAGTKKQIKQLLQITRRIRQAAKPPPVKVTVKRGFIQYATSRKLLHESGLARLPRRF